VASKMDKKEFMDRLSKSLKGISSQEKMDILGDIQQHFEMGASEGRTEQELAESLGNPVILGRQLKANALVDIAEKDASAGNITKAVFASLGLGLLNLIFVLGPFILLAGVLLILFGAAIAVTAVGITGFFASILGPLFPQYFSSMIQPAAGAFASAGITCMGLIFFIADIYLARAMYRVFIKYIRFNIRIIKGRGKTDEIQNN